MASEQEPEWSSGDPQRWETYWRADCLRADAVRVIAARAEAARLEERERIAAAIDEAPGFRRWIDDSRVIDKDVAIRIARTGGAAPL